jgi:hypothetical protein
MSLLRPAKSLGARQVAKFCETRWAENAVLWASQACLMLTVVEIELGDVGNGPTEKPTGTNKPKRLKPSSTLFDTYTALDNGRFSRFMVKDR